MLATESLAETPPAPPAPQPSAEDLARILELYLRGLCLQAYEATRPFGSLASWTGTEARLLAGRLALNLGAPRLGAWLHLRAWRADRAHPEACYYHARAVLERRGPLAAWRFLRKHGELPEAPAQIRGDWLAFHAQVLGRLRDFDRAEQWLDRAEQITPDRPWINLERAFLCELEDRYEESLQAARQALEMRPWYRPGVQAAAHALVLLHRDQEALELLQEAAEQIESGLVLIQLASLQTELGHHHEAQHSYGRYLALSPLLEKALAEWLAARQADSAYYCGEYAEAARFARQASNPFYTQMAEQLEKPVFEGRRVMLEVPFVRQHHQTCAPATLASLTRFWKMPADHLEVAAAICYDGTPDYRERAWAENNGWAVREFVVTWDSARALIDRGIPFTLTTIEPGSAHLQAVIGYDTCRNTLIIRDPSERRFGEFIVDTMLEHYRSIGPRGMALVPQEHAGLFDGLDLPEAGLYDQMHQVQLALQDHDRPRAARVHQAMRESAAGQRLTLQARRVLALYDSDYNELLGAVEELLQLFPDDPLLVLTKLGALRELARRDERLTILQAVCARASSDPIFWRQYAQELSVDARECATVNRLLRRAIRRRPYDKGNFAILANTLCDQRRFEEALELYGFAACLDDKDEWLARSYFSTARYLRKTTETLAFLEQRFRRLGARSSQPARTLYWAYSQYERMDEAFAVLEQALQLRPEDGELLLFTAQANSDNGRLDRAAELLARAEGHCQRTAWLRTAANLAGTRGDSARALELWREVVAAEPLALDANRALTQLLAETQGRPAALQHLEQACGRFPYNFALHQLWISWLRDEGPVASEPVIRQLLAIHPADAWGHRELALALSNQGRISEAFAQLEIAYELEPASGSYWNVRGGLCERVGRRGEALEAYRQAIRLSVDNEFAVDRLMQLCETQEERRAALAHIEGELIRQVIFGDGLLAYQRHARYYLPPEELLASLQKALEARPDLWHAWSAVIRQQVELGRADEAHELAQQAVRRFPLLPALRYDLAVVCRIRRDAAGEQAALEQALQINPGWSVALRRLAEVHDRAGRLPEARAVLEQAIARAPLDSWNHGQLAEVLWKQGEREAALARVEVALQVDPGHEHAWDNLRAWTHELGQPERAVQLSRRLTELRPDEARSWLMLTRMLGGPDDAEEQLRALERAIALNPRSVEAYDQKATILARCHRFHEALAACQAPVWDGQPPLVLRGRAAWVEAERGNFGEAIAQMRGALQEDPNYYWGWVRMTEWSRSHATNPEYLEAAEHMVRLAPQNPISFGYRGEARQRLGDRAGAMEDFQKALEIDPSYGFAGLALFDEQLEAGELDGAARTLDVLRAHDRDAFVQAREVQLAVRREARATARTVLAELAAPTQAPETWPLDSAVRALCQAGWAADAEEVVRAALPAEPQPHARWGAALRRLAEVHDRAGRLAEARALLELALLHSAQDARSLGYLADVLWKMNEREAALARLQASLSLDPSADHAWDDLRSWTRQMDQPEGAVAFARKLTAEQPENAQAWLALARSLDDRKSLDEQLEALDRALVINPRYAEAYDLKATVLAQADRYDEAAQACNAPVWNGQVPLILRGRAAWVEAERGETDEAIKQMQAVVAGAADYYWGWSRLTDWLREEGDDQAYLEAARNMVRLAPDSSVAHGFRADALLRLKDRAAAMADLRRSVELDPQYRFGALGLFDECLTDNEIDEAGRALEPLLARNPDANVLARGVQLASRRGDRKQARAWLTEVAASADQSWPLEAAAKAMTDAGWPGDVDELLVAALDGEKLNSHVAALWVDRHTARQAYRCIGKLGQLLRAHPDAAREAMRRYLGAIGKAKRGDLALRCSKDHAEPLRRDTLLWGWTGYALSSAEKYADTAAWMHDWSAHEKAESWMLINLVISLRALDRREEAARLGQHALTLRSDYTTRYHKSWLALDAALAGATEDAARKQAEIEFARLDTLHQLIHRLTAALLTVQQAAPAERPAAFVKARQLLAQTAHELAGLEDDRRAARQAYRHCLRRLAQDAGTVPARLWAWWRQVQPLLPAAKKVEGKK